MGNIIICWKQYLSNETVSEHFSSIFDYFMRWYLFDLILYAPVNIFSYVEEGLPGLNQYLVRILVLLKDTAKWRRSGSNP